jgi:uncharacterized damage-inducible protein DinB
MRAPDAAFGPTRNAGTARGSVHVVSWCANCKTGPRSLSTEFVPDEILASRHKPCCTPAVLRMNRSSGRTIDDRMPTTHPSPVIAEQDIARASDPATDHLLQIYVSEINKVASVWRAFDDTVLDYRPHPKSTSVADIFRHELLSGRRFFGAFLGLPEPDAAATVPDPISVGACVARLSDLARARLPHLASASRDWWHTPVAFFDVERPRVWVFWRRVLHTAHHRTQLTVYLRLLNRPVPSIYGPTADITWGGADPTQTIDAATRR